VRPATQEDGPAIQALAGVAGGLGWWGADQRTGPDRPDQARFVEHEGDELVAYGCVWRRRGDVWGLDTLVHPGRRGHGLGRALIDRLFEELAARGAAAVEARVDVDHADALQFILRRGFFELDRIERVRLDLDRVAADLVLPAPVSLRIASLA
jgi:ribosomal-protein-alanine N-acetyltransferase